jgi:CheY-like chemotaxis protein
MTMRHPERPTAKVLLVDARDASREALAAALGDAGYGVAKAPSGSFAVTMLEWECPDLVVSSAKVGDMDGYELFTLVRKDPTTMDTPFLLLAGRDRPTALAAAEAGVNMILTGDFTTEMVLERVAGLLAPAPGGEARPLRRVESAGKRKVAEPLWAALGSAGPRPPAPGGPASFQGSLGVMDLAEVTQAIALGGKTGCLVVSLAAGDGSVLFEAGRLVHASFAGKTGESAFAALIRTSQREDQASFRFSQAARAQLAQVPRTISRSVDKLLLSIAAGIDESGTGQGQPPPAAVTNQKGR